LFPGDLSGIYAMAVCLSPAENLKSEKTQPAADSAAGSSY